MTTDAGSRLGELVAQARDAASVLGEEDRELRSIAFERVLDHLLGNGGGNGSAPPAPVAEAASEPDDEPIDGVLATEQQRVDAAARYFDIAPAEVRELFDLSNGEPRLVLHSNKLHKSRAEAVREIALLVCGVRTAVGLDTGSQHIRRASDDFNKLDKNFMTVLGEMDMIAVLGKPGSKNRLVRMRVIGAEAARPLAQRLVA